MKIQTHLPNRFNKPASSSHMPPVAVRVAKVLMVAVEIERVQQRRNWSQPGQILRRFVRLVRVARRFRRLIMIIAQYSGRLFAATHLTRFRVVAAIGQWGHLPSGLNGIGSPDGICGKVWRLVLWLRWSFIHYKTLQSSLSLRSLAPRLNFSDLRLKEPPAGVVVVPRLKRKFLVVVMERFGAFGKRVETYNIKSTWLHLSNE